MNCWTSYKAKTVTPLMMMLLMWLVTIFVTQQSQSALAISWAEREREREVRGGHVCEMLLPRKSPFSVSLRNELRIAHSVRESEGEREREKPTLVCVCAARAVGISLDFPSSKGEKISYSICCCNRKVGKGLFLGYWPTASSSSSSFMAKKEKGK